MKVDEDQCKLIFKLREHQKILIKVGVGIREKNCEEVVSKTYHHEY